MSFFFCHGRGFWKDLLLTWEESQVCQTSSGKEANARLEAGSVARVVGLFVCSYTSFGQRRIALIGGGNVIAIFEFLHCLLSFKPGGSLKRMVSKKYGRRGHPPR